MYHRPQDGGSGGAAAAAGGRRGRRAVAGPAPPAQVRPRGGSGGRPCLSPAASPSSSACPRRVLPAPPQPFPHGGRAATAGRGRAVALPSGSGREAGCSPSRSNASPREGCRGELTAVSVSVQHFRRGGGGRGNRGAGLRPRARPAAPLARLRRAGEGEGARYGAGVSSSAVCLGLPGVSRSEIFTEAHTRQNLSVS